MGLNSDQTQNTLQTSDDIKSTVVSYSWPANATGIVQVRAIGKTENGDGLGVEYRYVIKRASGNCSIIGSPAVLLSESDAGLNNAGVMLNVNGSSISVDVQGINATVIDWAAKLDILYLNP